MKKFFLLLISFAVINLLSAQVSIVSYNSTWKYLDNGSNQGTAWRALAFNDATWATGPAQLGYGDGDEATVVSYGPNANNKYITTYFRKTITVADASIFSSFTLSVKRDDGAVVYINGTERFRTNMPAGTISYTTKASTDAADDGNTPQTVTLPAGTLSTGTNVIAVEIHQRAANSSDISFDLQLTGTADITPPTVLALSPLDNATGVANTANLVLTFSESIQKGTGSILIKEGGIVTQTIDVTSAGVTVAANTVTINPADFTYNAAVNVEMPSGVFKDLANNNYAGISDPAAWDFTIQSQPPPGPQTLVAYGATWKYLDNGTNQGTAWRATAFDDAAWASGPGQLGYGDGDEATVVSFGPNAANKYITTYFRKAITIADPNAFATITGNVKRDDGVAIYVNGTEVYRNNLAAGATYTTLATLASDDGVTPQSFSISPAAFVSGNNVIAVEIHQNAANSSDISFDLELFGNPSGGGSTVTLTRGPYLNMGNETAVTLRWRTDIAGNSKVELGTVFGTYPIVVNDAAVTTEHEVRITGLTGDTKYFYRFGSSTQVLQAGSDNFFTTAPPANTTRKMRFAAFGDCGRNDNGFQTGSLSSYLSFAGSNTAEAMLLLGDNAYNSGTDLEYQSNYFNAYSGNILKNHQLFPAPGNHDYANSAARQADHNVPYYSIFTNPSDAQCGGVASNTEAFYSWNWGNVHFLSLDSYGEENGGTTRLYDTLGAQVTWIKQDLAANTLPWIVAYWHHPPYTMGSHNSDTEAELVDMRQNFIRILERLGVDMILCGHSHDYERSYLLNGHYGNEASFNVNTHALTSSSGKYDGSANSCTYTTVNGQNHGTLYVVSGSAGADGGVQAGYPHNAMPWSVDDGGMFYFEVEDNRLDAKFIRRTGIISDQFTIMKNVNRTSNLNIAAGTPTQLTASWVGSYNWSTGETTRSITVSPVVSTTYTATDPAGCVSDVFNVTVDGPRNSLVNLAEQKNPVSGFTVRPTVLHRGENITVQLPDGAVSVIQLMDMSGNVLRRYEASAMLKISTGSLAPGMYFIRRSMANGRTETRKVVVLE